jgi:hypothetical protein
MNEYKTCVEACKQLEVSCPNQECRNWINYEPELNCVLRTIEVSENNGIQLTLRDVSQRIGCSFVRVKQIEEEALNKINKSKNINIDDFI